MVSTVAVRQVINRSMCDRRVRLDHLDRCYGHSHTMYIDWHLISAVHCTVTVKATTPCSTTLHPLNALEMRVQLLYGCRCWRCPCHCHCNSCCWRLVSAVGSCCESATLRVIRFFSLASSSISYALYLCFRFCCSLPVCAQIVFSGLYRRLARKVSIDCSTRLLLMK